MSLARSGGVFYGGLILAVVVAFWYIGRHRLPFWTTCDVFAPGIALGHVTGRLGCLAAGCCYGSPTDVPWAITFTNPLAAANVGTPLGIALHPTQVYEAGAELLILGFLLGTERRGRPCACTRSRASSSRSIAAIHAECSSGSRPRNSSHWCSDR
jgi:phosphatidylglycerol:prolipoprotein diacylglycerol transferase